jgi:hypothetical protein
LRPDVACLAESASRARTSTVDLTLVDGEAEAEGAELGIATDDAATETVGVAVARLSKFAPRRSTGRS